MVNQFEWFQTRANEMHNENGFIWFRRLAEDPKKWWPKRDLA